MARWSACAAAIAVPPLFATVGVAALAAAAATGVHPLGREASTIAGAMLAGDHARVIELIRQGHDPNRDTGAGLPIDIAVRRADVRLVRLLLREGVVLDEPSRQAAACAARRQGAAAVYELLRAGRAWTCKPHP